MQLAQVLLLREVEKTRQDLVAFLCRNSRRASCRNWYETALAGVFGRPEPVFLAHEKWLAATTLSLVTVEPPVAIKTLVDVEWHSGESSIIIHPD